MDRLRWLLGGLVAGLVYVVGGWTLGHVVMGEQFGQLLDSVDAPDPGLAMPVLAIGTRLAFGLLTVWLYAAALPRLGAGPRTAAAIALVVWFLLYAPYLEVMGFLRLLPVRALWTVAGWGLLETSLAALAGAWVYREGKRPASVLE